MEINHATYHFVDTFFPGGFLNRHGDTLEEVQFILMKHNWNTESALVEVNQKIPQLKIKGGRGN